MGGDDRHRSGQAADPARRPGGRQGAKLFVLPPCSPDLNPIEQTFAKLETLLRKAGERTVTPTWQRVGSLLDEFSPTECADYPRNPGYITV